MAPRCCIYLAHRWRIPKLMIFLLILELPLTIGALLLFGIADGDTYRQKLWQDGSNHHFNSNPNEILYEYANFEPVHTPLIWSSFLTEYNTVVAVLSMFLLLVKSTMYVLSALLPAISIFIHCGLVAIWSAGIKFQATPDLSNTNVSDLQRNLPWYLSKGCSFASPKNYSYCLQARASFGVSVTMLALNTAFLVTAIHSVFITRDEKAKRLADWEEEKDLAQYEDTYDPDMDWEARREMYLNLPNTPATPWTVNGMPATTPRTTAFNTLSGAEGEPSAVGRSVTMPARPLAFRERYGDREFSMPDPF